MTANHEHTPTVDELRRIYALKVPHDQRDRRNAEFDRFLSAAEQRGAERELRAVVAEFEHQDPNDLRNNSMRDGQVWTLESCMSAHIASAPILDWLENRADQEGDE